MFIEDLVSILTSYVVSVNRYDKLILISLDGQLSKGLGFTEKQKNLVLNLIKKYSTPLSLYLNKNITSYIDNPVFKFASRQVNFEKKISITEYKNSYRAIKMEFPYDDELINHIKTNKHQLHDVNWDSDEKSWFFRLTEKNILYIMEVLNKKRFNLDTEMENYVGQIDKIITDVENYVPMLCFSKNKFFYNNCGQNLPPVTSTDLLSAVFEARKIGISTWDDTISTYIDSDNVNPFTKEFLKLSASEKIRVNTEKYSINDLKDVVEHLSPTIFILPGGNELNKIISCYEFLKKCNINNEDISVLFRLPSSTGNDFNEFVKNHNLNSSLSKNTKAVIISGKIPKPLIKSKIKFHSIINLGYDNVHYTMREFVQKHENLIYFSEKVNQRGFNFDNL